MKVVYEHVTYRYPGSATAALQNISLDFDTGALTGICGNTGSGKSTFIQHLNGLLQPTQGRMVIDGRDIHASATTLRQIRQQIGMTFQFPERQFWGRTVAEEFTATLTPRHLPSDEIERRITVAADWVGIDLANNRSRSPFSLSRSEQRRVGIAVILSLQPDVIVLDEPTAGLDRRNAQQLLTALQRIHHDEGVHVILVSHHLDLLRHYAAFLIRLHAGEVVFAGAPEECDVC